jgi:hypothetical protein
MIKLKRLYRNGARLNRNVSRMEYSCEDCGFKKRKLPFLVKRKCKTCEFNGRHDNPLLTCSAHEGMYPAVWTETLWLITQCGSYEHFSSSTDLKKKKESE